MSAASTNSWRNDIPSPTSASVIQLPAIVTAEAFMAETQAVPPELVHGLIHEGTLTMFAGGSKAAKTFLLMRLGLSVGQGVPFWDREVVRGKVLYVNFEIGPPFFQKRLRDLSEACGFDQPLQNFDVWNLRGYAADAKEIAPKIIERCRDKGYSMIIIDPIYKLMAGRSENDAGDMAEFLNFFEQISNETGAAVVYSHHFAKGLAAGKDQLDRASGSGVFARHADGIITMTAHQNTDAFVVEATLRNFRAPAPFCLRWNYPLMTIDPNLDPTQLKNKAGRKAKYSAAGMATHLIDGMTAGEWQAAAVKAKGCSASTFDIYKTKALEEKLVRREGDLFVSIPKVHVYDAMTRETSVRDADESGGTIRKWGRLEREQAREAEQKADRKIEKQEARLAARLAAQRLGG
jgi:hypothetical protein